LVMKTIELSKYGPILSSKSVGDEIYKLIKSELEMSDKLTVDLADIKSMATFCAKQIFGKIYIEIGSQAFFDKIIIKGADNDLKTIIQIGIQHALQEKN
jgi:hypothetical protein